MVHTSLLIPTTPLPGKTLTSTTTSSVTFRPLLTIPMCSTLTRKNQSRWATCSGRTRSPLVDQIPPFVSLLSEIHGNEIRKLELECRQLSQIKSSLDNELLTINEKTNILSHKIQHIIEMIFPSTSSSSAPSSENTADLLRTSLESVERVDNVVNKHLHLFNGDQDLLKKKLDEQDNTIFKLKQDLNVMMKQCNDTQTVFAKTNDNLVSGRLDRCARQLSSLRLSDELKRRTREHPRVHAHLRGPVDAVE